MILKESLTKQLSPQGHALEAVGRFSSNLSDVSERHDNYLAEAFVKEVRPREHNFGASDLQMRHF